MNTSGYLDFVRCQELMAKPIANKPGENYIVATDDDNLISRYSQRFHNDGYIVEVVDLITPANSTVSFDVLQQLQSIRDAKWLADQLEAPWLQDDPYWHVRAATLIASFIQTLKHADRGAYISTLVKIIDDLYLGVVRDGKAPWHIEKLIADIVSVDPRCDLVNDLQRFSKLPIETQKVICKHSSRILHYYFRYSDSSTDMCLPTFDTRNLLENKTVLFVRVDSNCIERNNCACLIFKCLARSLYCQLYDMKLPAITIKTNFLCGPQIFQSLCCDILGDSIALHLGLHMICLGFQGADDDLSHILARAIN